MLNNMNDLDDFRIREWMEIILGKDKKREEIKILFIKNKFYFISNNFSNFI